MSAATPVRGLQLTDLPDGRQMLTVELGDGLRSQFTFYGTLFAEPVVEMRTDREAAAFRLTFQPRTGEVPRRQWAQLNVTAPSHCDDYLGYD